MGSDRVLASREGGTDVLDFHQAAEVVNDVRSGLLPNLAEGVADPHPTAQAAAACVERGISRVVAILELFVVAGSGEAGHIRLLCGMC